LSEALPVYRIVKIDRSRVGRVTEALKRSAGLPTIWVYPGGEGPEWITWGPPPGFTRLTAELRRQLEMRTAAKKSGKGRGKGERKRRGAERRALERRCFRKK